MKITGKIRVLFFGLIILTSCTPSVPETRYSRVSEISISPNGNNLVVADINGVWIYDLSSKELLQHQTGDPIIDIPAFSVSEILWSPNEDYVAVAQDENGVWIWHIKTWELVTEFKGKSWREAQGNPGFTWSPDGEKLALGTGGGNVTIWDKSTNQWETIEKKIKAEGTQLGILWTKENQLTTILDSKMFDVETGEFIRDFPSGIDGIGKINWTTDEKHLYVNFDMGCSVVRLSDQNHWFCGDKFSWSNDGQYFAAFYQDKNIIRAVDTNTNETIFEQTQGNFIYALAWTPSDELLAVSFTEEKFVLRNVYTDKIVLDLSRHVVKQ